MKKSAKPESVKKKLKKAVSDLKADKYLLRLYVTGSTPRSMMAINKVKTICEEHLKGRYELEVIDIYQNPALAAGDQIIAIPTLIKMLPAPRRRIIGDMTNTEKVLLGLDLKAK